MKRARLQEDAQAYEAQISQAYTPIVAPSPQQLSQHPSTMPPIVPPQESMVDQVSASTTVPPAPMASQTASTSTPSSSRQLLCCDEPAYDMGNTHSYEQPVSLNRYNSPPILKMSHPHQQPPMEKYEPTPESAYKYGGLHAQQQDYEVPAPGSSSAHDYDPLPPQVPVASDEEPLVYPNVGVDNQAEPPSMHDPHMPPGYFSHYPLETQGNLESQDPLDYSDLDALFEGGSYPPPGDTGNPDNYQGYQQY